MRVHSVLPDALTRAVDEVLEQVVDLEHVPGSSADSAAADAGALALIGPYRSIAVAEASEATTPAGLPLLAPFATWSGITRPDEPIGPDDPPDPRGTILRLVARDTVVAERIAAHTRAGERRAFVVAGAHPYGRQLDEQLERAELPRVDDPDHADLVVLCGLAGEPEIDTAAALAPLPLVAFDGVQGSSLGERDTWIALPYGAADGAALGVPQATRAAALVAKCFASGALDRAAMLAALHELGPFDEHGDPVDPPVWLWRAGERWELQPHRPLPAAAAY